MQACDILYFSPIFILISRVCKHDSLKTAAAPHNFLIFHLRLTSRHALLIGNFIFYYDSFLLYCSITLLFLFRRFAWGIDNQTKLIALSKYNIRGLICKNLREVFDRSNHFAATFPQKCFLWKYIRHVVSLALVSSCVMCST